MDTTISMSRVQMDVCIQSTAKGDMTALKMLYEQFKTPVYLLALLIVKDRALAEDMMQETFIGLQSNAHTYRMGTNAKAWIFGITRNLCKNALRKRCRETVGIPAEPVLSSAVPQLDGIVVSQMLDELDDVQRMIVVQHIFTGLKHTETARLMNLPYGTVLWKYSEAMKKLRLLYSDDCKSEVVYHEK